MTVQVEVSAGRELDALVAEKVMGWTVHRDEQHEAWYCNDPSTAWNGSHVPRYSTDIAAAWQVVEHLKRCGFCVKTETWPNRPCEVSVLSDCEQNEWRGLIFYADTVPLAICRAALAAVTQARQ